MKRNRHARTCCVIILLLAGSFSYAQLAVSSRDGGFWQGSFEIERPGPASFQSVSFLQRRQLFLMMAMGMSAYAIHRWDSEIDEEYALEGHGFINKIFQNYGKVGRIYDAPKMQALMAATAVGILLYSRIGHKTKAAETVSMMFKALAVSTVITTTLKVTIGRHRPYTGYGPYDFEALDFYFNSDAWSFPSGHTSSIFALSTVLAKRSSSRWIKVPVYAFAGSVGFQRMLNRKHWASDVIIGGLIGYMVGHQAVRGAIPINGKLHISPWSNGQKMGVQFAF